IASIALSCGVLSVTGRRRIDGKGPNKPASVGRRRDVGRPLGGVGRFGPGARGLGLGPEEEIKRNPGQTKTSSRKLFSEPRHSALLLWPKPQAPSPKPRSPHGQIAPEIGIGARSGDSATPATPPGMRVRTGRFGELRSRGQPRDAQLIEVTDRQGAIKQPAGVIPPPPSIAGDLGCMIFGDSASAQLAIEHSTTLPLLQM